jgi:eukaryotic-like serine/threonine-protein kinase
LLLFDPVLYDWFFLRLLPYYQKVAYLYGTLSGRLLNLLLIKQYPSLSFAHFGAISFFPSQISQYLCIPKGRLIRFYARMILRIHSLSIFNLIAMKMTAHPLKMIVRSVKTQSLVTLAVLLFTASCKKSNPGPFVTPVALPPADLGVYSFIADWEKDGPAGYYNLYVATDAAFTQPLNGYNPMVVRGATSFNVTGLSMTTPYYYRLTAVAGKDTTILSNIIALTTADTADDRYVYIGSEDQNFYCYNALTGVKLWSFKTKGDIESSATIANGTLYFAGTDQRLYSLNPLTGVSKWGALAQAAILTSPTYYNGSVYFSSYAGRVFDIDTTAGKAVWNMPLNGTQTQTLFSSPTVANGLVYVGGQDHNLYALDATTGVRQWAAPTGDTVDSSPAVSNGTVYVGSSDWHLYAFDAVTGNLKWSALTDDSVLSSPTIVNGVVYVGSFDAGLYAFEATTGQKLWRAATNGRIQSSPIVSNGVVYVGSFDNSLYAFNASTGAKIWSAATGDRVMSSPVVGKNAVYVGSYDNSIYAFDITTGAKIWSTATGGSIRMSSPVVLTFEGNVLHPGVSGDQQ